MKLATTELLGELGVRVANVLFVLLLFASFIWIVISVMPNVEEVESQIELEIGKALTCSVNQNGRIVCVEE